MRPIQRMIKNEGASSTGHPAILRRKISRRGRKRLYKHGKHYIRDQNYLKRENYKECCIYSAIDSQFRNVLPKKVSEKLRTASRYDWEHFCCILSLILESNNTNLLVKPIFISTSYSPKMSEKIPLNIMGSMFVIYSNNVEKHCGVVVNGAIAPIIIKSHKSRWEDCESSISMDIQKNFMTAMEAPAHSIWVFQLIQAETSNKGQIK